MLFDRTNKTDFKSCVLQPDLDMLVLETAPILPEGHDSSVARNGTVPGTDVDWSFEHCCQAWAASRNLILRCACLLGIPSVLQAASACWGSQSPVGASFSLAGSLG